jgi:hypothetical protein
VEKGWSKQPVFTTPKKKVDRDCMKEMVLAVRVQMWVAPYLFKWAHDLICSSKSGFNVVIIGETV